jgi:hypothetical protein
VGTNYGYILLEGRTEQAALLRGVADACASYAAEIVEVAHVVHDLVPLFLEPPRALVVTALAVTVEGGAHPGVDELAERLAAALSCGAVAAEISDFYQSAAFQLYREGEAPSGILVDGVVTIGGHSYSYLDVATLAIEALFGVSLRVANYHRVRVAERALPWPPTFHRIVDGGERLAEPRPVAESDALELGWGSMAMTYPLALRHARPRLRGRRRTDQ